MCWGRSWFGRNKCQVGRGGFWVGLGGFQVSLGGFTSKDTDILMKKRMNICHVDLQHAQTTKTTTNKTKTIQDYLGGSSVQKST